MKANDFLEIYCADGFIKTVAAGVHSSKVKRTRIKGLAGSLDAVVVASSFKLHPQDYLVILHDKEEASYFQNDLQNFLGREVLIFPMSYKRIYEYDDVENANILMRTEVLSKLSGKTRPEIIVTYPEALSEKVINKRSLSTNTFTVTLKEKLDVSFLEEFLHNYDFEKTDFVFEAGQFAVRGGIIDIFSFAYELPCRIELFGDEVDSIRTFDPGSQLSVETLDKVSIIPNIQSKLMQEERQSLLEFISPQTRIWYKDFALTADVIEKSFDKAETSFDKIIKASGTKVVSDPKFLFDNAASFKEKAITFHSVEFGSRFIFETEQQFDFRSSPQPSFNKNFELLAKDLYDHEIQGFSNFITADLPRQNERLKGIFDEINPQLHYQPLDFALRQGFVDSTQKLLCYTDHQIFERFHRYRAKEKFTKSKALTLRELQTLQPGDFVTHIDYGIGKFAGLEKKEVNGHDQEAIRLVFRDDDLYMLAFTRFIKYQSTRVRMELYL